MKTEEPPASPLPLKYTRAVFSVSDSLTEWTVRNGEREEGVGGGVCEGRTKARLEAMEATGGKGGLIITE